MDYRWMRGRQPSNHLTADAVEWMQGLPAALRPRETAIRYGRVVNEMAVAWSEPRAFHALMLSYLVNDRPTKRAGFPPAVAAEINRLKGHVQARYPDLMGPWDLDALCAQEARVDALLSGLELSIA
jgi:hypothetical protein